jgi:sirohydrochlorin ferrochelatase
VPREASRRTVCAVPENDRPGRSGAPTLVAVAHGTRDPDGAATVEALLKQVRALRPGLATRAAYLEVAPPSLGDAVQNITGPVVVLPLLLAGGYHATVDIPRMVATIRAATPAVEVRIGAVLGPHPLLAEALGDRLREAGWRHGEAIVLAAAGSSDPAAVTATEAQAGLLADLVGGPVVPGYASAVAPSVPDAVADLRSAGVERVAVASYLLAPGHFQSLLAAAAGDVLSEPLGSHEAVARLVLARYEAARLHLTLPGP